MSIEKEKKEFHEFTRLRNDELYRKKYIITKEGS